MFIFCHHILGEHAENSHSYRHLDLSLFSNSVQNIKYLKKNKKKTNPCLFAVLLQFTLILNPNSAYLIHKCNKMTHPPLLTLNSHKMPLHEFSHKTEANIPSVMYRSSNTRESQFLSVHIFL